MATTGASEASSFAFISQVFHVSSKPRRDTRQRNRIFFLTVAIAVIIGLWLAR